MTDECSILPDGEIVGYDATGTGWVVDVRLGQENVGSPQRPMRQRFRTSIANSGLNLKHELVS